MKKSVSYSLYTRKVPLEILIQKIQVKFQNRIKQDQKLKINNYCRFLYRGRIKILLSLQSQRNKNFVSIIT